MVVPDLSLEDFEGIENEDVNRKSPMSALAFVCKVALSKNKKWEEATKHRKELKQKGKNFYQKCILKPVERVRNSIVIKEADTDGMAKKTKTSRGKEESFNCLKPLVQRLPWSTRFRKQSESATEDCGGVCSTSSGLLELQGTKFENQEADHVWKRSLEGEEDRCYKPEPISVCPPMMGTIKREDQKERSAEGEKEECHSPEPISVYRPRTRSTSKVSYRAIEDDESEESTTSLSSTSSGDLLALQSEEEDEVGTHKRKRSKRVKPQSKKEKRQRPPKPPANTGPDPPPGLPESFTNRITQMGGINPVLVIQKRLWSTDLNKHQNRLSIPITGIQNHQFITEDEKLLLNTRNQKNNLMPISVKLLDAEKEWNINLRRWEMAKKRKTQLSTMYVLNSPWNDIVIANNWIVGDIIQLWAFRVEEKLALAILKVEENLDLTIVNVDEEVAQQ